MSNKRTKQEKARIIEKCLDIEAEGGDVLKYLREEEHYVSPAATWFNIQRIELARDPYHRTSGKPTGIKITRQQTPAAILAALDPAEVPPVQLNGMREKCRMVRRKAGGTAEGTGTGRRGGIPERGGYQAGRQYAVHCPERVRYPGREAGAGT